jgi:NAD(P)-dependent dehydrogenase (short-subunit alcohol dehydrogenase family)
MRILVIGASGTIGQAVVQNLGQRHEIVSASRQKSPVSVDVTLPASLRAMFATVGHVDAIVSLSGGAKFAPLEKLTDEDFNFSLANKLMGQVNVVRLGLPYVRDGGSITITSGVLAWKPMTGAAAISLVNAALEGFAGAAAFEAPRGIRVNVVSPPWVTETLAAMKWDTAPGRSAKDVATLYAQSVEGYANGKVIAFPS